MDVREKLVQQAISHFWYGVSHDIFSEPVTTYAKLAIEALKKENGVMVQEWISVEDRLPEESGLHITFGCTAMPVRWLHNFDKDMGKFGVWWDYDTDGKKHPRYRFIEAEDITHWMPLPEPPKEG